MLGKCPDCGGKLSDTAKRCFRCGYDTGTRGVDLPQKASDREIFAFWGCGMFVLVGSVFVFWKYPNVFEGIIYGVLNFIGRLLGI